MPVNDHAFFEAIPPQRHQATQLLQQALSAHQGQSNPQQALGYLRQALLADPTLRQDPFTRQLVAHFLALPADQAMAALLRAPHDPPSTPKASVGWNRQQITKAAIELLIAFGVLFMVGTAGMAVILHELLNWGAEAPAVFQDQSLRPMTDIFAEAGLTQATLFPLALVFGFSLASKGVLTACVEASLAWMVGNSWGGRGDSYAFYLRYARTVLVLRAIPAFAALGVVALIFYYGLGEVVEIRLGNGLYSLLCLLLLEGLALAILLASQQAKIIHDLQHLSWTKAIGCFATALFGANFLVGLVTEPITQWLLWVALSR